jgi:hypothetical protein
MRAQATVRRGGNGAWLRSGAILSVLAAGICSLVLAPSASAFTVSVTVGIAPISTASGSYVLKLTNTGSETITGFFLAPGESSHVDPSSCVPNTPFSGGLSCSTTIAPGASFQVCYTGSEGKGGELLEFYPGTNTNIVVNGEMSHVNASSLGAVSACPVAGFNPGTTPPAGTTPPTGTTPPAGTTPTTGSTTPKCVVPKLKGKTLAAAEKALSKAHCKTGKIKHVKSAHAKKGTVIAQGTPAGKSLPGGTKVALTESKGK